MAVDRECDPDASRNLRREVLHSYAKMLPLPRRHGLSVSQFEREHLATSQPVVLADALRGWPAIEWSLDHIEARCGQRPLVPRCHDGRREHEYPARLRRFNDSLIGHEWVAMQELSPAEAGVETVGELVRRLRSADGDGLYLHDQSIGSLCPLLLDDVRAPRWFPVDLKLQVPALNQCDPLHPSIFVGRDGTRSGFHVDSDATRFWMVVLRGSKRFRLYAPVVQGGNGSRSSADELAADQPVFEGVVSEGELIFIPEHWPHSVVNLATPTVTVSYNLVDEHNLAAHVESKLQLSSGAARKLASAAARNFYVPVPRASDSSRDEEWRDFYRRNRRGAGAPTGVRPANTRQQPSRRRAGDATGATKLVAELARRVVEEATLQFARRRVEYLLLTPFFYYFSQ